VKYEGKRQRKGTTLQKRTVKIKAGEIVIIAAAFALTAYYIASAGGGFPLDDSWIHQTYGRNLGVLGQFTFYPDTPSAASTSPLYTVVLAVGYALRIDYRVWTHMLGAFSLAAIGLIGTHIASRLHARRIVALAVGAALVSAWHLVWAAASGMETALFATLALCVIAYTVSILRPSHASLPVYREAQRRDNRPDSISFLRSGLVFGVLSGFTVLARPEGVLIVGLCGVAVLGNVFFNAKIYGKSLAVTFGWLIAAVVSFMIVITPYMIANFDVTGGLLPNTAGAKRAQADALFALSYSERLIHVLLPLAAGGQILLVPGLVVFGMNTLRWSRDDKDGQRRATPLRLLLLVWGFGLIALYAAYLPLDIQHGRYVIPALPALITAGVLGTLELWSMISRGRNIIVRAGVQALMLGAVLVFAYFALVIGRGVYIQDVRIIDGDMVAAAAWIQANIAPDQLLAIHDIGAVGYFAPRPMLDIGGLISPEVIPIIRDGDAIWALMRARGAAYLMAYGYQTPNENPNDARLCPLFTTNNLVTRVAGGAAMVVYRIANTGNCADSPLN